MSIEITEKKCIGCGHCCEICPGSLIRLNQEGKARISRPERCWGCASCVKVCPVQAIALFLGEDMGGLGGRLTVQTRKELLSWQVTRPDGSMHTITVNPRNANKY